MADRFDALTLLEIDALNQGLGTVIQALLDRVGGLDGLERNALETDRTQYLVLDTLQNDLRKALRARTPYKTRATPAPLP